MKYPTFQQLKSNLKKLGYRVDALENKGGGYAKMQVSTATQDPMHCHIVDALNSMELEIPRKMAVLGFNVYARHWHGQGFLQLDFKGDYLGSNRND